MELAPAFDYPSGVSGAEATPGTSSKGLPIIWGVAGVGVLLLVIAAVVLARFEFAMAPRSQSGAAVTEDKSQPAIPSHETSGTIPGNQPQSQAALAPSPLPQDQSSVQDDQYGDSVLEAPNSQRAGGLAMPPSASTVPIDGNAFKTNLTDILDKLGSLAQIDPIIRNIGTGIAGLHLFDHGEEQAGQSLLQEAASANISFAAAALGHQFFGGTKTLRQDYGEARKWFDIASRSGDIPVANYELSVIYARGLGVKPDLKLSGHYFLAAYHGSFEPVVEIVTAAKSGQTAQRQLLRKLGLDPNTMGLTVMDYYNARRASDPTGARQAIEQLAEGLQWPAPEILATAQWNGDFGQPDRAAAAKNYLIAGSGGAFAALIPVAQASLDGSLGSANSAQAGLLALLLRLHSSQFSLENLDKLHRVYRSAFNSASLGQRTQLDKLADLLAEVAPAGSEAASRSTSSIH
ncbi:MAG TPA: hypothetical protein VH206_01415 [Xanthobacteraceae bacterium]|nr:hypothetical protein [Xanthobacteraceae bacterium]